MKMTLLEIVQDILSAMESDEVNSISDTVESQEAAYNIRDVFFQLVEQRYIPELEITTVLTALADVAHPNYLQIPDTIGEIHWWKYNKMKSGDLDDSYLDVKYLHPKEFVDLVHSRKSSDDNIVTITDFGGIPLLIQNDQAPEFYTSFDDLNLVTDSWDSVVDTTLQSNKSLSYGSKVAVWDMEDDFIPPLDDSIFPLLLAEAKATCFMNMKQTVNPKVEAQMRSQKNRMQSDKHRITELNKNHRWPNFGRGTPNPARGWATFPNWVE